MISLYSYYDIANFGDALCCRLVELLSGQKIKHAPIGRAELSAVGSILFTGQGTFIKKHPLISLQTLHDLKGWVNNIVSPRMIIWGTGFIKECGEDFVCPVRKLEVVATRGRLTADIMRRAGVLPSDDEIVYGDPGLLYPMLLGDDVPMKRYDVGVVPHFMDRVIGSEIAAFLSDKGYNAKVIDVGQKDPLNAVREISACHTILSSSLHGLIVADALGIPNRQIMLSVLSADENTTIEDYSFKFRDYYSAFNMRMQEPIRLNEIYANSESIVDFIKQHYNVDIDEVNRVKEELLGTFPFPR